PAPAAAARRIPSPPMNTAVLHHIDGRWTASATGAEYPNHDPWTGAVLSTVAAGDAEDARRAIDAAQAAFPDWARSAPAQRQLVLLRAAEALARRRDEILALL